MKTTVTSGQMIKTLELLDQKGMTPERYQLFLGGLLSDLFEADPLKIDREKYRQFLSLGPVGPDILEVDYSQTLEQMLVNAGWNFSNSNTDIKSPNFPISGSGLVKMERKLFHFGHDISTAVVERRIVVEDATRPWAPAPVEFLLASGIKYPQEQVEFPIVGLGSSCEFFGVVFSPCLDRDVADRSLYLYWRDDVWRGRYRFLAVRPVVV